MNLPNFSIKRPVTTVMIFAGVILFGIISLLRLPQELFPPITYPELTVVTTYLNAAPQEIETLITKPVEEAIGTVSGLRRLRSVSREGLSLVIAEFGWAQNMDFAALRMREKIDLIKERLPRESEEPIVMKYNPFEMPIMTLSVTGERSPQDIREIARKIIKEELEKIEGVASAAITGGLEREVIVEVDQGRLHAQKVPLLNVARSITDANLNYPAGTIKESFYEYLIRTLGEFEHVDEIQEVAVKVEEDQEERYRPPKEIEQEISKSKELVLIKDIGTVYDTVKERTSFSRYNGEENVSLSVQKQAQANTLQVVNRVKKALGYIREEVPPEVKISVVYDQSKFIKDSINGVRDAAIQGGILAFLVLLLFLRNVRSSVIVTFSIPISIVVVFTLMYMFGLSVNMMSLGGLALGVGMLVDSAIVVLENISRHKELGEDEKTASVAGATEVSNAITASTLTTIVVFFPMIFIVGIAGQLFKQLAFTVIFALLASLLVALTLIPLLASAKGKYKPAASAQQFMLLKFYERVLVGFLRHKRKGLLIVLCVFIGSLFLFGLLDKELMPKVDQGQFIIKLGLPSGTRLEVTNDTATKIENYLLKLPYVEDVTTIVGSTRGKEAKDVIQRLGSHQAEIRVNLKRRRKLKTSEAVQDIKKHLAEVDLQGGNVEYILQESVFSAAVEESSPIVVEIKGEHMSTLMRITEKLMDKIAKIRGIYGVRTDMPEASPETKVFVNKDKASVYNLSVADIAQTAQIALKGYIASQLKEKGQEIDIRVRLRERDRDDFNKLSRILLHTPDNNVLPLLAVARFGKGKGPSEIKRLDQERTIVISANIFKRPLKDIIRDIQRAMGGLDIPEDYTVRLAGESEEMTESFNSLRFALIFSIVLVYMIMAAQFESLWQPFIIMATVPLSVIGVLLALFVTGTSINVVAILGVIMLGGIVVNNGIVLIDYLNLLRSRGKSVEEAVVEASKARLRPILMTAFTTVLGLLPMAVAFGEGSELRSPLAISVIGGLFVATFLTLLVVPALYLLAQELGAKLFKK